MLIKHKYAMNLEGLIETLLSVNSVCVALFCCVHFSTRGGLKHVGINFLLITGREYGQLQLGRP